MNFSMDQGLFMLKAWEIWNDRKLELIGPSASPIVNGRHFFQGPITYYWLVFVGILVRWDPIKITWVITLMSLVSMGFLYLVASKIFSKKIGNLSVIIWTFLPMAIDFAGLIWNPSLLLILVPPTLYVGVLAIKEKKWWLYGIFGLFLGFCLQCHFQAVLLVFLAGVVLLFRKTILKNWILIFGGLLVGYSPLIIFDLRNNFYNIKTIFEWLGQRGNGFEFQQFYFLEFLPILTILVAKVFYRWRYFLIAVLVMCCGWSVMGQGQAEGMPMFWRYKDLTKSGQIIMKKSGGEFNVVNLLSGDTRFYPLRYLLTVKDKVPMSVDKYDTELWVAAYKGTDLKNSNVWELEKMKNMKEVSRIEINPMVELIQLR